MPICTYETARTAPTGKFEIGGGTTPLEMNADADGKGCKVVPHSEVWGRVGVAPNWDIGARWGFGTGVTLTSKYRFINQKVEGAMSFLGTCRHIVSGHTFTTTWEVTPQAIVSREVPGRFPFAVCVGLDYFRVRVGIDSLRGNGNALGAVIGFGVPLHLGPSDGVRLMPQVVVSLPFLAWTDRGWTPPVAQCMSLHMGVGETFLARGN
jgi:hypothetical protein